MFKNIFKAAFSAMVNRWISGAHASHHGPSASPIHLNTDELRNLVVRVGSLTTLVFLNFLLFVGALVVTAVAVAHSFDVYDHFVGTAVFWTGLIMGFTALIVGALCGWALLKTKFSARDLVIAEPVVDSPTSTLRDHLLMPFLEGLAEGFRRPRTTTPFDRDVA